MTFHHVHPQRYAPMGVQQMAGGAREWAWAALGAPHASAAPSSADGAPPVEQAATALLDLDAAAAAAAPGAGSLLFLPYLMGERSPWWNPLARGAFVGLGMQHGKPELARAVLEGVAFGLRQILDALREQAPGITALRLIGGGGKSRLWQQILADVFQLPIHMLELKGEATSWGAAVAAGVAIGAYDWSIAAARGEVVEIVDPNPAHAALYDDLLGLYTATYTALAPIYTGLAAVTPPASP
jgi:xylulokinase